MMRKWKWNIAEMLFEQAVAAHYQWNLLILFATLFIFYCFSLNLPIDFRKKNFLRGNMKLFENEKFFHYYSRKKKTPLYNRIA